MGGRIERVIHNAEVITIEGASYRLREAEIATTQRKAPRKKGKKSEELARQLEEVRSAERTSAR